MQTPFPVLRQTLFDAGEGGRDVKDSHYLDKCVLMYGMLCITYVNFCLECR